MDTQTSAQHTPPRLIPLTKWNEHHPWPPIGGLRHLVFHEKSNGFDLEHSSIRNAPALTRLSLVLACAIVFLVGQGTQVVKENKRRLVDPHWYRGKSYFRIGWDWVKAALVNAGRLISKIRLYGGDDPDPAMASFGQHLRRQGRAYFEISHMCLILNE